MIKVWYADFWGSFNPYDNWFSRAFLEGLDYKIDPIPDVLIYSTFGQNHKRYSCKKIHWTGENTRPPLQTADFSFGFDYIESDKYMRLPLYVIEYWNAINEWKFPGDYDACLLRPKQKPKHTKFCAFIYGNSFKGVNHWGNYQDGVEKRIRMFEKLNSKKKVDSLGSALNNTGTFISPELPKINCISDYKFTFAIENSSGDGYVTEKIMDPMIAHSVPIYWGSSSIKKDFQGGFLNLHEIDEDDAIETILEMDAKPELYEELYFQPYMEKMSQYFDIEIYKKKIREICA